MNKPIHYRYEREYNIFPVCEKGDKYKIKLRVFNVVKETKKGYWISEKHSGVKNFVLKESKKRYAYPTKQEALVNFKARTEISKLYAKEALNNANCFLELLKDFTVD